MYKLQNQNEKDQLRKFFYGLVSLVQEVWTAKSYLLRAWYIVQIRLRGSGVWALLVAKPDHRCISDHRRYDDDNDDD